MTSSLLFCPTGNSKSAVHHFQVWLSNRIGKIFKLLEKLFFC